MREKVALCKDIMRHSDNDDETLVEVVDFLAACQRRLPDIIEAGTMGMLCEELLAEAVEVNDLVRDIDIQHNTHNASMERSVDRNDSKECMTTISTAPTVANSVSLPEEVEDTML